MLGLVLGLALALALSFLIFRKAKESSLSFFYWFDESLPIQVEVATGDMQPVPPGPLVEPSKEKKAPSPYAQKSLDQASEEEKLAETKSASAQKPKKPEPTSKSARVFSKTRKASQGALRPPLSQISKKLLAVWIEKRVFPQLKSVSAEGVLPSGLVLLNSASYGVGLLAGDRLVAINGQAVGSPIQALGVIVNARNARVKSLTAKVVRQVDEELQTFYMAFAQPYDEDLPVELRSNNKAGVSHKSQEEAENPE